MASDLQTKERLSNCSPVMPGASQHATPRDPAHFKHSAHFSAPHSALDFSSTANYVRPTPSDYASPVPKWLSRLDDADMLMLQTMGCMSREQIMAKITELHELSYALGLEEAREMTRGKYLNIFPKVPK